MSPAETERRIDPQQPFWPLRRASERLRKIVDVLQDPARPPE
jgi:hypothetical protein